MIRCRLEELLNELPPPPKSSDETAKNVTSPHNKMSLCSHADAMNMGRQQFSGLFHNHTVRPSIKNLQKARDYLATGGQVQPGEIRFNLGDTLQQRGLTKSEAARIAGLNHATVQRMANNQRLQANYEMIERLLAGLKLENIEQVIDTGGLLAWEKDR